MNRKTPAARVRPAEAGFTLVEIMVVIVIIGLLATLVVQNVVGLSEEAKVTKAQTDVKMLAGAVKMYKIKKSKTPDSLEELVQKDDKGGGNLIDELPQDPWGHDYEIRTGNNPNDWEVTSPGPDGLSGTEDDISSKTTKEN